MMRTPQEFGFTEIHPRFSASMPKQCESSLSQVIYGVDSQRILIVCKSHFEKMRTNSRIYRAIVPIVVPVCPCIMLGFPTEHAPGVAIG